MTGICWITDEIFLISKSFDLSRTSNDHTIPAIFRLPRGMVTREPSCNEDLVFESVKYING